MFETSSGVVKPIVYVGIVNAERLLIVKYRKSPNPTKAGWWIPAPGLEFGQDPNELAKRTGIELGISIRDLKLQSPESFSTQGGWHLIWYFRITTDSDFKPNENIQDARWVSAQELDNLPDLAHGPWEAAVGRSFLEKDL